MKRITLPCILFVLLLTNCNFFEPRESEAPSEQIEWNTFFTNPYKTVDNLIFSYEDKRNLYRFSNIFTSNYKFYFDNQDINEYNLPENLSINDETDVLDTFYNLNSGSEILLTLEEIEDKPDNILAYTADIYRFYNLTIIQSGDKRNFEYTGELKLELTKQDGLWKINKWYDFRKNNLITWGMFKYENYNN